mmetsp:Transcript_73461/g.208968  ORF Transcript_73461/g.208968 Transcript_73461/m.208968 type:complete len:209 (+) Transcript_73461:3416-4042(+)
MQTRLCATLSSLVTTTTPGFNPSPTPIPSPWRPWSATTQRRRHSKATTVMKASAETVVSMRMGRRVAMRPASAATAARVAALTAAKRTRTRLSQAQELERRVPLAQGSGPGRGSARGVSRCQIQDARLIKRGRARDHAHECADLVRWRDGSIIRTRTPSTSASVSTWVSALRSRHRPRGRVRRRVPRLCCGTGSGQSRATLRGWSPGL